MFNTKIPLYGIIIIISLISGLFVVYINMKNIKLKKEEKTGLLIYIFLGAVFGAKYFSYFTNIKRYNGVFEFEKIGLSSYGAVIGIIIMLLIFSKQFKKKFSDLLFIILPSIPLMYGIGKIGCFVAGCCYGIRYSGPLSVTYNYSINAPKGMSLFPIQLLEAIVFIIIFIYLIKKQRKNRIDSIGETFILCGISKFSLDFLRMSHMGIIISINQIVSILFILIGIYLVLMNKRITDKK